MERSELRSIMVKLLPRILDVLVSNPGFPQFPYENFTRIVT